MLGTSATPLRRTSDVLKALADEFESSYELVVDQLRFSRHGNKHLSTSVKTVEDAKAIALSQ